MIHLRECCKSVRGGACEFACLTKSHVKPGHNLSSKELKDLIKIENRVCGPTGSLPYDPHRINPFLLAIAA